MKGQTLSDSTYMNPAPSNSQRPKVERWSSGVGPRGKWDVSVKEDRASAGEDEKDLETDGGDGYTTKSQSCTAEEGQSYKLLVTEHFSQYRFLLRRVLRVYVTFLTENFKKMF